MSRTDKDMPLWVRATRWTPHHFECEYAHWRRGRRECNLPEAPPWDREARDHPHWSWFKFPGFWQRVDPGCAWMPDIRSIYPDRLHPSEGPPKWFVDHVGNNAERRRSRDECIQARKEHRATGEVDVVPTVLQHRHQAIWLYW